MSRRLAVNLVLRDPGSAQPVVFTAGSEVPEWAASEIDNDAVWESEPDDADDEPEAVAAKPARPARRRK